MLGLGIGLIITALTTKYRDLAFLVTFGIQLLMYTTTVIYPLSTAPLKYYDFISLNPMTGIIEAFRFSIFGFGQFNLNLLIYSTFFSLVSLVIGILIFNKTEKSFIDTI
jgi:lipopolysaccharide transport system permease protein